MIFMGVFDFGWLLHKQIQLDQATRAGARRAAVGADNAEVLQVINNTCGFEILTDQIDITVKDPNGSPMDSNDRSPDNCFTVEVTMNDVQLITPLQTLVDAIYQVNLHSESTFIIE